MPIDPEKLRGGAKDGHQINVRVSDDAKKVIDFLHFVNGHTSIQEWLIEELGATIEAEVPYIRESLGTPEVIERGPSKLTETLDALNRLCPPEETPNQD